MRKGQIPSIINQKSEWLFGSKPIRCVWCNQG